MKFFNYIKDCCRELKRLSWPTKQEVSTGTVVVIVSTIIAAVILGAIDWLLYHGISIIFKG